MPTKSKRVELFDTLHILCWRDGMRNSYIAACLQFGLTASGATPRHAFQLLSEQLNYKFRAGVKYANMAARFPSEPRFWEAYEKALQFPTMRDDTGLPRRTINGLARMLGSHGGFRFSVEGVKDAKGR